MPSFNPDSPRAAGLEWFPTSEPSVQLSADTQCAAGEFAATATETIDRLYVGLEDASSSGRVGYEVEVYDLDALTAGGSVTTTSFLPTADAVTNTWGWSNSTQYDPPGPFFNLLDELTDSPGNWIPPGVWSPVTPGFKPLFDKDFISGVFGVAANWAGNYGSVIGAFTTEHVLAVRVVGVANEFLTEFAGPPAGVTITPYLRVNGNDYDAAPVALRGEHPTGQEVTGTWYVNPATGCSWSVSDVEGFDDSIGNWSAGFKLAPTGSPHDFPAVFRVSLEVDTAPTDPRLVTGCLTNPAPGWNLVELASNWAKVSGTRYLVALRLRSGRGWAKWRYLAGADAPGWERNAPKVQPSTRRLYLAETGDDDDRGDALGGAHALIMRRTDDAISVDTQPYFSVNGDSPTGGQGKTRAGATHNWVRVNSAQSIFQLFTAPSSANYGFVRVLARAQGADTDATLTVKVKKQSDNSQVGSTITFARTDLVPTRTKFQVLEGQMASAAALTNGTGYYLEVTCAAAQGSAWDVQVLSPMLQGERGGPPAGMNSAGFTGTCAIGASVAALVTGVDAAVTIHTLPTAPATFAASPVNTSCAAGHTHLSWTATSLSSLFMQYEVERLGRDGVTWQRIATIDDEAVTGIDDWEGGRNATRSYRIRVRRSDHATSVWSSTVTAARSDSCCGLQFSSNLLTSALWYDDLTPRAYKLVEQGNELAFQGRDGSVAYYELEDRLDTFTAHLLIASSGGIGGTTAASTPGRRQFDALAVMAGNKRSQSTGEKTTLPYVCVSDELGNTWFAHLRTGSHDAVRSEPGAEYSWDVDVVEATTTPYPINATAGS